MNLDIIKELSENLRGAEIVLRLVYVLAVTMAIDYATGTLAAIKSGEWSSAIAREGLWHKGGTILIVLMTVTADCLFRILIGMGIVQIPMDFAFPLTTLTLAWYSATELGSSLENAVKITGTAPRWLAKALKIAADVVDNAGSNLVNGGGNDE